MGSNHAAPKQTLRAVEKEALLHDEEGDILLPLKRVRDQYTEHAEALDEKMPGPGASDPKDKIRREDMLEAAAEYRKCAAAVQFIIGGLYNLVDFPEPSALVDQTELILSDVTDAPFPNGFDVVIGLDLAEKTDYTPMRKLNTDFAR